MIKIGDTVKVTGTTVCGGFEKECISIGTICEVTDIDKEKDGTPLIGIKPVDGSLNAPYWYLEKDLEKGHLEWIKE